MSTQDDRFIAAALAEDGMPISAGLPDKAQATERFRHAAIAENGSAISAGVVSAASDAGDNGRSETTAVTRIGSAGASR